MRKIYLLLFVVLLAMPVSATVRYVDASRPDNAGDGLTWAAAHKYLQTALAAAVDGDQIWVAQGTYKPTTSTTDRNATFVMKEGVAIYGGFTSGQMNLNDRNTDPATNGTVLSSDIDGDGTAIGNAFRTITNFRNGLTLRAVLDGFKLSGGNQAYNEIGGSETWGGAIALSYSSPMIIRCLFQYNNALTGGAVVADNSSFHLEYCSFISNSAINNAGAVWTSGGSPIITNCTFKQNIAKLFHAGALLISGSESGTEIRDCKFENNRSYYDGGALSVGLGEALLKNCSFRSNTTTFGEARGGALWNEANLQIQDCEFVDNYSLGSGGALYTGLNLLEISNTTFENNHAAYNGGALLLSGYAQVTNCLFRRNSSLYGGAVYTTGNSSRFINCSFLKNSVNGDSFSFATGKPGAVIYSEGVRNAQFTNCILWDNNGSNAVGSETATNLANVRFSVLDAALTTYIDGGNNIKVTQSPFLSDTDAQLRPAAPAIDAGLNSANSTITDIAGHQRIINNIIDMGAYEFSDPANFAITAVSGVNCQELSETARQITFTPTYTGTDGSPITFSVYGELAETTAPGPYSLRLYKDNPVITLIAKEATGDQFSYRYDWLAACGTPPPPPPPTGDFAITGVSGVNCQELSETARQLTFTPTYSGTDGSPITFSVYGELAGTTTPGPYSLRLYKDNPVITLTARQGTGSQFSFRYNWLAACGTPPPPPPPTGDFAITGVSGVECQTLSSTARQLTFTPTYSGTDGSPITFSVYGELAGTTAPGPYSLLLYKDNPVITLTAKQGTGSQFSFRYDWLAACNASAVRLAAYEEPGAELQVKILGNPVNDGMVKLEVRGAQGQPLALRLMDMNGRLITEHQVEQAGVVESHSLELGQQATGLLLLRVNTPSQHQTVKILHVR